MQRFDSEPGLAGAMRTGIGMNDLRGAVAVVTGGAAGIGRGIVEALVERGPAVVIADIEAPVLDAHGRRLSVPRGGSGVVTDVSDPGRSRPWPTRLRRYGACHVLWNNAGVTSGGGGNPWDQEPNDWRWCFGVNVFGTANGVLAFVPRMIESGEHGVVVTTSSGDGGIAPVPYASVYASSKAAISCFTEALAHQFVAQKTRLSGVRLLPFGRPARDRTVGGAAQPARTRPGEAAAAGARAPPSPSSRRRWPPPGGPRTRWTWSSWAGSRYRG